MRCTGYVPTSPSFTQLRLSLVGNVVTLALVSVLKEAVDRQLRIFCFSCSLFGGKGFMHLLEWGQGDRPCMSYREDASVIPPNAARKSDLTVSASLRNWSQPWVPKDSELCLVRAWTESRETPLTGMACTCSARVKGELNALVDLKFQNRFYEIEVNIFLCFQYWK